jgi:guanylate cyclase
VALRQELSARLDRLVAVGVDVSDNEDERVAKGVLVTAALAMSSLAVIWYATMFALGRPGSAAIPLTYQILTFVGVYAVFRTHRFAAFRNAQLGMMLMLPALLQWSLGGFVSSGAMLLWAFATALGAQIFAERPWRWMAGFFGLTALSAAIDPWLVANVEPLPATASRAFFALNLMGIAAVISLILRYFISQRDRARAELEAERARSEMLLLNILPEAIATRLKAGEETIADAWESVTVLFADIVDFTPTSARLGPESLVRMLSDVFGTLDRLAAKYGLEKIKTIGDAYMVVGGLPTPRSDHLEAVARFALEAASAIDARSDGIRMRFGMETGPVVAGVIGATKFSYDLWGDTVNTASRMTTHGLPGRIQVTDRVCHALGDSFLFEPRGIVEVKGKGPMQAHFLVGPTKTGTDAASEDSLAGLA